MGRSTTTTPSARTWRRSPLVVAAGGTINAPSFSSWFSLSSLLQDPQARPSHPEEVLQQLAEYVHDLRQTHGEEVQWDVYGDFLGYGGVSSNLTNGTTTTMTPSFLRRFEQELAEELGMEDAVFMPSGVMAQSIALLIHRDNHPLFKMQDSIKDNQVDSNDKDHMTSASHWSFRPARFLCHESSHLLLHEQDGYRHLLHMEPVVVSTKYDSTVQDTNGPLGATFSSIPPLSTLRVQETWEQLPPTNDSDSNNDHGPLIAMIVELPHRELGGKTTSWEDLVQLQDFCHSHDMAFHCDGARLLEATAAYDNKDNATDATATLRKLTSLFDSVYLSCYKGMGGSLSGGVLLGTTQFCASARIWLRRFGGNLYTLLPMVVAARKGYEQEWRQPLLSQQQKEQQHPEEQRYSGNPDDTTFLSRPRLLSFRDKKDKLVRLVGQLQSQPSLANILAFDPPVPETNMVHVYLRNCTLERCQTVADQTHITVELSTDKEDRDSHTSNGGDDSHIVQWWVESKGDPTTTLGSPTSNSTRRVSFPLIRRLRAVDPLQHPRAVEQGYTVMFEWTMGQANGQVDDAIYVEAWRQFGLHLSVASIETTNPVDDTDSTDSL